MPLTYLFHCASISHVSGADNVSFVYFANLKHSIFWSRSDLLQWLCKAPCFSTDWGQMTIVNWRLFSWHRHQGSAVLQISHPGPLIPFSHRSTKQPQFASTVFCRAMLQMQSLSTPVLKIPCRDEGVVEAPIFCPNSCQQLPQLMRGKWSPPSCKNKTKPTKTNTPLLLITSQHNSDKAIDSQYILLSFFSSFPSTFSYTLWYTLLPSQYWALRSAKNRLFDCAIPCSLLWLNASLPHSQKILFFISKGSSLSFQVSLKGKTKSITRPSWVLW